MVKHNPLVFQMRKLRLYDLLKHIELVSDRAGLLIWCAFYCIFKNLFIYLFIFDCVGSSLLRAGFL